MEGETQLKRSIKEGRPRKETTDNIIKLPELWMQELQRYDNGNIKNTMNNYCIILENDEKFKGKIHLNELSKREEFNNRKIENLDLSNFKNHIEYKYQIYSEKKFPEALSIVAGKHRYHPIKEYLESLKWDGIKRADNTFHDYLGAEKNEYNAMCLRLMLYGAIERVYYPGSYFGYMLIIKGAQGIGKSTMFQTMCGDKRFYQENLKDIDKSFEYTNGKWIVEMGELSAFKKAQDNEKLKDFITKQLDTHRIPFAKLSEDYPRQFILIGTTNETTFLNDDTGNRRFVVVEGADDKNKTKIKKKTYGKDSEYELQQILAEVYQDWKVLVESDKDKNYLRIPQNFEQQMQEIQSSHSVDETEKGIVEDYLERKQYVCLLQIWCEAFGHNKKDKFTQYDKNKLTKIILSLPNWRKYTGTKDGRKSFNCESYDNGYGIVKMNYGKQTCYEKFITDEEIKKQEIEKQNKQKQKSVDVINKILKDNYTQDDLFKDINLPW